MPLIMDLNYTDFKKIIKKEFPKEAERILEIVDDCDYSKSEAYQELQYWSET